MYDKTSFELLVRVAQETFLCCLPEMEGKSLLMKTEHTSYAGPRST